DVVARDVAAALGDVRVNGESIFTVVPRDAVYRGHRIEEAPDLILLPQLWEVMPGPSIAAETWAPPTQAGIHREDGILFSRNFDLASPTAGYRVEDIAPTCLARLGLP